SIPPTPESNSRRARKPGKTPVRRSGLRLAHCRRGQPEVFSQPSRHLEVLLPREGDIEDVKVLLGQAHAAKAVVAVREVAAKHQVGRVGTGIALEEVGRGLAGLAFDAVATIAASLASHAVGALVAAHAVLAEHAVGAALAVGTGVAAGIAWVGGEGPAEGGELVEKFPLAQCGDALPRL